jgi:hypothetical protein
MTSGGKMEPNVIDRLNEIRKFVESHKSEKRPRHFANEIIQQPEQLRSAALAGIPEHYRAIVTHYVTDHFRKLDGLKRMVLAGKDRYARREALARVPESVRCVVETMVIDHYLKKS